MEDLDVVLCFEWSSQSVFLVHYVVIVIRASMATHFFMYCTDIMYHVPCLHLRVEY